MAAKKVCVIGSGLAGMAAAASARRAGADVVVLQKGAAATAFSSGALDVCADPCAPHGLPAEVSNDTARNIARLIQQCPLHPYAILAAGSGRPEEKVLALVKDAVSLLFPAGGLVELDGDAAAGRPCFTTLGTVKFTSFFPTYAARPGAPGMERPAALGIRGHADFEPRTWAKVAAENAGRLGLALEARAAWLELGPDCERGSPELAAAIARDPEAFLAAVKDAAAGIKGATALILAPVLPARGRGDLLRRMAESLAMPVYEPLSLPPSVPGLRLMEHLGQRAQALGIETIRSEVTGYEAGGDELKALLIKDGPSRVEADAFVLASGKFLGGGIVKDRAFSERIFNLPVFVEGRAPGEVFIEKVLALHVTGRHSLFEAGIKVDTSLRPLMLDEKPRFKNLFAAGAILAGHNYINDGTGSGVALATGVRAGTNAVELRP
ncbi:MAG TPA: FAD-binding protein [bacterium]|nr:FAD-binding protein [bacterium]